MKIDLTYDSKYGILTKKFLEFRASLAKHLGIDADSVIPTNGATGSLDAVFSATKLPLGRPRVALLASLEYFDAIRMLGLQEFDLTIIPNDDIRYPTAKVIDALRSIRPDLYYVSVPNNPTGFCCHKKTLIKFWMRLKTEQELLLIKP